ncbi:hypothetical protein JCM11251_004924 [Rhodosporidiobolus azoricus]
MGFTRAAGGTASALFRLISYIFLRWIPGRFGPYLIPLFFLFHTISTIRITSAIPSRPSTSAEAALVPPSPADRPSFADIVKEGPEAEHSAVHHEHPHVQPPATPNGSIKKKKKKGGARDPLNLIASGQSSASDPEPGTPTQSLTKRQRLPRNRPLPEPTSGQIATSLIFGTPTPSSRLLNWTAWGLNALILAATLDMTWAPYFGMQEADLAFARIGHVSHNSVKLVARIPPSASLIPSTGPIVAGVVPANNSDGGFLPVEDFQGAKLVYRVASPQVGKWQAGPDVVTTERKDWVATVKIEGLWAGTEYEYRLLRPTLDAAYHPSFPHSQRFTTFSDPALLPIPLAQPLAVLPTPEQAEQEGTYYTFASSSCVKPGFPYTGPWGKKTTKGAKEFLKIAEDVGVRFMVFLGDFLYADVPIYQGIDVKSYLKGYRQVFASPEVKKMVEKIPMVTIYDDHEIYNDFAANESSPYFAPANEAYQTYLGEANPDAQLGHEGESYYDFRGQCWEADKGISAFIVDSVGDSSFFVWDTRKFRSDNANDDDEVKTMLGEKQKEAFLEWAARVNNTVTWKFVVSSVPLMTLWSHGEDTWASFTTERDSIMHVLETVKNVIVLSGDRHEFAAASIRDSVTEFSTSPFNMFYLPIRTLSQKHGRGATGEDVLLHYAPDGNTKFTTFTVDSRNASRPVVNVKLYVDGKEAWKLDVLGKQVRFPARTLLGGIGAGPEGAEGALGQLALGWRQILNFVRRSFFD